MGYVVLARKYRPQGFDEIVGQEPVTRTLKNALAQARVHHAYLFCGSRGIGKTTTARVLAKALNCDRGPTPEPCGRCVPCEEIRQGTAIDVLEIDGASNNSVDNVRELCENARYLPARGKRKVYIIDEVHMLSQSAFNALLKTLEEPPAHVSFIFATTEVHRIPATILSRCQRFDFRRLSHGQLRSQLQAIVEKEQVAIDPVGLGVIARAAEGSLRDALSLLDQVIAYTGGEAITESRVVEILGVANRQSLVVLIDAVLKRDAEAALRVIDEVFRAGQDLGRFSQSLLAHLRDLVVAATVKDAEPLLDMAESERADVVRQAKEADRARLLGLFDRFGSAVELIARAQNPKVVLEITVLDLFDAEPMIPLGDLLDRLEALESRLVGRAPAPTAQSPTATPRDAPKPPSLKWPELVSSLERSNPALAGVFALGKPLRVDEKEVVVGFAEGSFELQQGQRRMAELAKAAEVLWGRRVSVRIEAIVGKAATPLSVVEVEDGQRSTDRAERRREALGHPTIQAAVDLLGGNVRDVKAE